MKNFIEAARISVYIKSHNLVFSEFLKILNSLIFKIDLNLKDLRLCIKNWKRFDSEFFVLEFENRNSRSIKKDLEEVFNNEINDEDFLILLLNRLEKIYQEKKIKEETKKWEELEIYITLKIK